MDWGLGPFVKYAGNPILAPTQEGWESHALYNPTAWTDCAQVFLLYRAEGPCSFPGRSFTSRNGLALSRDGIHYARQAALVIPVDIALPSDDRFGADVAEVVAEVARGLGGRTLVLFTSHAALRDAAARLGVLEDAGIAVLAQGDGGSRRALLDRFAAGRAVLLGTQSFCEGVDLPGDLLRCGVVVRLPFAVPESVIDFASTAAV